MKTFDRQAVETRIYSLFEYLFKELDLDAIRDDVRALRSKYPDLTREKIAQKMIRKASMATAIVGAGAGVPGGPIGILAMAPDIFNLVRQQSRLVLSIAFLYDQEPDIEERFKEVLATLAVATGTTAGRQGVRYLVVKGLEGKTARVVLEKIAGKFVARKAAAIAPVVGSVAGAGFNYFAVRGVGRVAIDYYSRVLDEQQKRERAGHEAVTKNPPAPEKAAQTERAASSSKKASKKTTHAITRTIRTSKKESPAKQASGNRKGAAKKVSTKERQVPPSEGAK